MDLNTKVEMANTICRCYSKYCSTKNDDKLKIVYASLFKKYCWDVLDDIKRQSYIHDMDFEREFEVCLCKITIAINGWCKANGIFGHYKEKRYIKHIDKLVEQAFGLYINKIGLA